MFEVDRKIDVEWAGNATEAAPVRIIVETDDRPGLLAQITQILSNEKANIKSLEARTNIGISGEGADIEMTIDIRDKKQLEKISGAIRRTSGVRDVKRLFN